MVTKEICKGKTSLTQEDAGVFLWMHNSSKFLSIMI